MSEGDSETRGQGQRSRTEVEARGQRHRSDVRCSYSSARYRTNSFTNNSRSYARRPVSPDIGWISMRRLGISRRSHFPNFGTRVGPVLGAAPWQSHARTHAHTHTHARTSFCMSAVPVDWASCSWSARLSSVRRDTSPLARLRSLLSECAARSAWRRRSRTDCSSTWRRTAATTDARHHAARFSIRNVFYFRGRRLNLNVVFNAIPVYRCGTKVWCVVNRVP